MPARVTVRMAGRARVILAREFSGEGISLFTATGVFFFGGSVASSCVAGMGIGDEVGLPAIGLGVTGHLVDRRGSNSVKFDK